MNKTIRLVVALMTLCVVILLSLQSYWNYQSYQNNARVFRSDVNDALAKAVSRSMDLHREKLAEQYRKWLSDTNLVIIGIRYLDKYRINQFTLQDKDPIEKRGPFTISYSGFSNLKGEKITPASRLFFINKMMDHVMNDDLKTGSVFYYTPRLARLMEDAFKNEQIRLKELEIFYSQELAKHDINEPFKLKSSESSLKTSDDEMSGNKYATRQYLYGFRGQKNVSAGFINPSLIFLSKMKLVLISSLVLIIITITCFVYTIRAMLSQKKFTQLKDDFVNNMTHELKTPVSTISIAAEAIQDFNLGKNSSNEYLGIIRSQASALTNLIDQILENMVNNQVGISLEHYPVKISAVIEKSIQQCRPLLQSKNAILDLHLPHEEICVAGDAVHVGSVIINLIDNAVKYGRDVPIITIRTKTDHDLISIFISNEGEAIPVHYQNRIFERFFRIPSGNVHNVKGYGLGLSYARDIIQRHNGSLTLKSGGETTTFIINLPLLKHEATQDTVA